MGAAGRDEGLEILAPQGPEDADRCVAGSVLGIVAIALAIYNPDHQHRS